MLVGKTEAEVKEWQKAGVEVGRHLVAHVLEQAQPGEGLGATRASVLVRFDPAKQRREYETELFRLEKIVYEKTKEKKQNEYPKP